MKTIGPSCATAIALAGIVYATDALALSLESGRCTHPFVRDMTVYLPKYVGADEQSGAMPLSRTCSPEWSTLETYRSASGPQ